MRVSYGLCITFRQLLKVWEIAADCKPPGEASVQHPSHACSLTWALPNGRWSCDLCRESYDGATSAQPVKSYRCEKHTYDMCGGCWKSYEAFLGTLFHTFPLTMSISPLIEVSIMSPTEHASTLIERFGNRSELQAARRGIGTASVACLQPIVGSTQRAVELRSLPRKLWRGHVRQSSEELQLRAARARRVRRLLETIRRSRCLWHCLSRAPLPPPLPPYISSFQCPALPPPAPLPRPLVSPLTALAGHAADS
jgi:hypothetical protein